MKNYSVTFIALLLLCMFSVTAIAEETVRYPTPKIDERTELLGIVFRLAGIREYQCHSFKEYDDAINEHFADFKKHLVIQQAKMLRNIGIGYDAVPAFAIHTNIEDGHIIMCDENSDKTREVLLERWPDASVKLFIVALDDFYRKSRFHEFFTKHQNMYRTVESEVQRINEKVDYDWFTKFFGVDNLEHFRLILNLTSENNGYGAKCRFKDEHEEFYAILGVSGPGTKYQEEGFIPFLVHEFNHSFCDTLIDKYFEELTPAADRLFPMVAERMSAQAYPRAKRMLNEYLVRACEIRYLLEHGQPKEANRRIEEYRRLDFLWIEELVEAINRYTKEREKYPTLESFMPEIVKLQKDIITDEYIAALKKKEESRPKVVSTNPKNGAKNVDPAITEISVTFDRKMSGGMAWCTNDGDATSPKRSSKEFPKWSEDGKTCTMTDVQLEPGKTYNIYLNLGEYDSFQSEQGVPLKSVHYTFSTK